MAEDKDESQKTEEPTQKRLDEALKKGQVATSREINHWFMMLAAAIGAAMFLPDALRLLQRSLIVFLESPHAMQTDLAGLRSWMLVLFGHIGLGLLPLAVLLMAAAVGARFLQSGFVFSIEPIKPRLDKISLTKGLKRLFSMQATVEFVKAMAKLAVVGAVSWLLLRPEFDRLERYAEFDMVTLLAVLNDISLRLLAAVVAVMTVIAGLDFLYQRFAHARQLRMTREELRDEFKESEGDPLVKGRLRQIRMERARRRMMQEVPKADVVITNPTHFAVALRYEQGTMGAPRVVAKGTDLVARRIRELAEEHKVPIVRNPPLARALYATVELDDEIPPEHYRAVAEVIGYVMKLKRGQARPGT